MTRREPAQGGNQTITGATAGPTAESTMDDPVGVCMRKRSRTSRGDRTMTETTTRSTMPLLLAVCVAFVFAAVPGQAQTLTKPEYKCLSKVGKSVVKLASTVAKSNAKCRDADISGKAPGACPDAKATAKIGKAVAKVEKAATKKCLSTCGSAPSIECVDDLLCPPPFGECNGGAKGVFFNAPDLNLPGPYCPTVGVSTIEAPTDISDCASGLAQQAGQALLDTAYGAITSASGITPDAASCLSAIGKGTEKLASTVAKSVAKCRDGINKGKLSARAETCQDDPKTAAKIAKAVSKLEGQIDKKCTDATVLELDLCGNGIGGTADLATAKSCLTDATMELADTNTPLVNRSSGLPTIIESGYPPAPSCGDNMVNGDVNAFHLIGEECDGSDSGVCSGGCLPPGDVFECTCADRVRYKFEADATLTDSSAGWTGNSLEQKVGDRSGFLVTLLNCDCAGFAAPGSPNCTGGGGDTVCDIVGRQQPVCDWDVPGPHCEGDLATENDPCASNSDCGSGTCIITPHCDVRGGDPDFQDEDEDCAICDDLSTNPGTWCNGDEDCGSQCYPIGGGLPSGACTTQANCASGEICLGRCDMTRECVITPDGAPFPVLAANTGVCSVTVWRDNVTGTIDLATGEHQFSNRSYSRQYLGEGLSRPCPVCGGICEGGLDGGESCVGRCRDAGGTGSLDKCRFDSDCTTPGESCSGESADCREGLCNLELVCGASPGTVGRGDRCEIFFVDPVLGAMSEDCQPSETKNITGVGFPITYIDGSTTSQIVWNPAEPCTAPGYELYECLCPGIGGQPTQPNTCDPACDSGPNFGLTCAQEGTVCAAGVNAGKVCDEDTDCPGSTCSLNPLTCSGDPGTNGLGCTTNGDCGLGTCGDACPGGRCVPLCVDDPGDPGDGICAVGPPTYHCLDNPGFDCTLADSIAAGLGDCNSTCSGTLAPCGSQEDCPVGETCTGECLARKNCEAGPDGIMGSVDDKPGIGECGEFVRNCQPDPVVVEGGTTINGLGDAENVSHVGRWCFTATNSAAVNSSSGFPGPGVIRRKGKAFISVDSIP
jgi:hypothetical protein